MFFVPVRILFFPINGSGLGHLSRTLAYARRLPRGCKAFFFSLCPLVDVIEKMGFPCDYFISPFWSENSAADWNAELANRFRLTLEKVRPKAAVFDGTWPFAGFVKTTRAFNPKIKLVWSRRGLLKEGSRRPPWKDSFFNLILTPGEDEKVVWRMEKLGEESYAFRVPPVTLDDDFLDKAAARAELGLPREDKLALVTLGSGNLKASDSLGLAAATEFLARGYKPFWLRSPLSLSEPELPPGVKALSLYPAARYFRAFDVIVSAAGYNSCYEISRAGTPALFVPNEKLADNQLERARSLLGQTPLVILENEENLTSAMDEALSLEPRVEAAKARSNGATLAARAIAKVARGIYPPW